MLQSICVKKAASFANSGAIAMACQRRQATAYLLIPLHCRSGGKARGVVSVYVLNQSFLEHNVNC